MEKKYKTLSLLEKVKLIQCVEKGVKRKKDIAADFGIPANTLSSIIKNKEKILAADDNSCFQPDRKRMKTSRFPLLETSMVEWMKSSRNQNIPLSGPIVQEKAAFFAAHLGYKDFKASSGWLENFKKRNGIVYRTLSGESASVSEEDCEKFLTDSEILDSVKKEEPLMSDVENDAENQDVKPPLTKFRDAEFGLAIVRRFLSEQSDVPDTVFAAIDLIENFVEGKSCIKQKKITDFFY